MIEFFLGIITGIALLSYAAHNTKTRDGTLAELIRRLVGATKE